MLYKKAFKDETYVSVISTYIIEEMQRQMEESNGDLIYWVQTENGEEPAFESFKTINPEQSFYINKDNHLVIAFNKYDVAPGYMGLVTFEIPTEIIQDLLISNYYIN